jgi:transcriptional regulator GlxA family with amidase domain
MQPTDYLINAANEDAPAAIPSLIDAAVAAFDVDVDASRRYLLRASALLGVKRGARSAESARRSEARGGLLAWQLNRVLDYIETHLADKITAMGLADLIEVSTGKLFRAFKISVGVTPFHYITRRRVELACTMMKATREPLSQLAIACGLCDQAHLCRVFRRTIGMSPSAWRRAMPEYAHIEVSFGGGPKIGSPKPTAETVTNAALSPRGTTHDGASMPSLE